MALQSGEYARRGDTVTVVTLSREETDFYVLAPGVRRVALRLSAMSRNSVESLTNTFRRLIALRRAIQGTDPGVVVSFVDQLNVMTLMALLGTGIPVIVTEHLDPRWPSCSRIWRLMRRLLYPLAAALVSTCEGVDRQYSWLPARRRQVNYNPLTNIHEETEASTSPMLLPLDRKRITAMGRLVPQKGFDLLIQAFSEIASLHPDWDLLILGEGPERTHLEEVVTGKALVGRVSLIGLQKAPFSILKQCHLFVLSSRAEGFGNVLIEAMACGLPVISFDCPSGPSEIIRHGEDGWLVPAGDVKALSNAIDRMIRQPETRQVLQKAALQNVQRFSLEKHMKRWDDLFLRLEILNQSR